MKRGREEEERRERNGKESKSDVQKKSHEGEKVMRRERETRGEDYQRNT